MTNAFLFALLFFALGLIFGSFGGMLVGRLPVGEGIGGRSRCPRCLHALGAIELLPVVSYLVQRGRCHHCRRPISVRYPLLELSSAMFFLSAFLWENALLPAIILAPTLWLLSLIAVIDGKTRTIPDVFNLSFLLLVLVYGFIMGTLDWTGPIFMLCFFGVQWILSQGRWIGSGDLFLGFAIGVFLGTWERSLLCLAIAYGIGAIVAVGFLSLGRATRRSIVAFGPFLTLGALLTFFVGDTVLQYLMTGVWGIS